jgi:hypothetical protein
MIDILRSDARERTFEEDVVVADFGDGHSPDIKLLRLSAGIRLYPRREQINEHTALYQSAFIFPSGILDEKILESTVKDRKV